MNRQGLIGYELLRSTDPQRPFRKLLRVHRAAFFVFCFEVFRIRLLGFKPVYPKQARNVYLDTYHLIVVNVSVVLVCASRQ
jgi:hypothetical protein